MPRVRTRCLLSLVSVAFVGLALATSVSAQSSSRAAPARERDLGFVPGEILVKLKEAPGPPSRGGVQIRRRPGRFLRERPELAELAQRYGISDERALAVPPRRGARATWIKVRSESLAQTADPERTKALLAELRQNPAVEYAELNVVVKAVSLPNDPYLSGFGSWGQSFADLWGHQLIAAPDAWDVTEGQGVVVAVIDTGADRAHEDLAPNLWLNPGETGLDPWGYDRATNGWDDDGNGYIDDWQGWNFVWWSNDPTDDNGHGTHVSGTVAAVGGNGLGIVGVAPRARLMPLKALDSWGWGTIEDVNEAIVYAANNGADVINLSLGGSGETPQSLIDAVDYAHDTMGVVVVAAAGNDSWEVGTLEDGTFPANLRDVITVAASDHTDQRAYFSNFGKIDVAAPGGGDSDAGVSFDSHRSILSLMAIGAGPDFTGYGELIVSEGYGRQAGTSMAAPHVAGVAALVRALNPGFTPEQVRQAIRRGSDDILDSGFDRYSGYGRVNAAGALGVVSPLAAQLTAPTSSIAAFEMVEVRGTAAGPDLESWQLYYGESGSGVWTLLDSATTPVTNDVLTVWDTSTAPEGALELRLIVRSMTGYEYEDRMGVTVDSIDITSLSTEEVAVFGVHEPIEITGRVAPAFFSSYWIEVYDSDFHWIPSPAITLADDGLSPVQDGLIATWDPAGLPAGHYYIHLWVWLSNGWTELEQRQVVVDPTLHAGWPIKVGPFGGSSLLNGIVTRDMDGDGDDEILVAFNDDVNVFDHTGAQLPGWPQKLDHDPFGPVAQRAPAAADLDGDGRPEVIATNSYGVIAVWDADGNPFPGWPQDIGSGSHHVAVSDVSGDGMPDIVTSLRKVSVFDASGVLVPGWPTADLGSLGPPSLGDLDGDGGIEVVVATTAGDLYVFENDGTLSAGWPLSLGGGVSSLHPALGDIDEDGDLEIVVGTRDGTMYALHHSGVLVSGWPQVTEPSKRVNPPAIGDIDGDGHVEIVAGIQQILIPRIANRMYAWRSDGTLLPGWPVTIGGDGSINVGTLGFAAPALADVDGDGISDVVLSSDSSYIAAYPLQAFGGDGSPIAGFPKPTSIYGGLSTNAPAVAEIDGDGLLELVWIDIYNNLYVWDLPGSSWTERPWPMFRSNSELTGAGASATGSGSAELSILVEGFYDGRGSVLVSPLGTACDNLSTPMNLCTETAPRGTVVTLTPEPEYPSTFVGWGGACEGTGPEPCTVTMSDALTEVQAYFIGPTTLEVFVVSPSGGTGVVSLDGVPFCDNFGLPDNNCSVQLERESVVTLTAEAFEMSRVDGIYGANCNGSADACEVAVTGALTEVWVVFEGPTRLDVFVTGLDEGHGIVNVEGVPFCDNLGLPDNNCSALYSPDTVVTLTATAAEGSRFGGWGGPCWGTDPCTVTLSEFRTEVWALFEGPRRLEIIPTGLNGGEGVVYLDGVPHCDNFGLPDNFCTSYHTPGTTVTLTAEAGPGSHFEGFWGECNGTTVCEVTLEQIETQVYALFDGPRKLLVNVTGLENGEGVVSVNGSPFCDNLGLPDNFCETTFTYGDHVTLTAEPAPLSTFAGWFGACSGTGACELTFYDLETQVYALFEGPRELEVFVSGLDGGQGSVHVAGVPFCDNFGLPDNACRNLYTYGTTLTLVAEPGPLSTFTGWGGACAGLPVCEVTLENSATRVEAHFDGPRELSVVVNGIDGAQGSVAVDGSPFCDNFGGPEGSCSALHRRGSELVLTAVAAPDAVFVRWDGACAGNDVCLVTLNESTLVSALFDLANRPPTANAGAPQTGFRNTALVLDGTLSSDPDGDPLTYRWDFGDGAVGSGPSPAHAYANVGEYTATLVVNDGTIDSSPATTMITIENRSPVADAGAPIAIELGATAVLDGSASMDPDGDALAFVWRDELGAVVGADSVVSFLPPLGDHPFQLTVTDVLGASSTDTVLVSVRDTTAPVVTVTSPSGGTVRAGEPLEIAWSAFDLGTIAGFNVFFSMDGGQSFEPLASCAGLVPETTSCLWPASGPVAADARIRVVAHDVSGNSGEGLGSVTIFDVLDVRVSSGSDDAEESSGGSVSRGSGDLDFASSVVGVRFDGVALPQGALIRSAHVRFTANRSRSTSTSVTIFGEASDNAETFRSRTRNITSRPPTSSSIPWQPEPWVSNEIHVTPELGAVIQEIVDRPGWQSGNAIALGVSLGTGRREAKSYNKSAQQAPELHIEYTITR